MAKRRSIQVEVEVAGTQEQAWHAVATGPGVSAWFVPTRIDCRVGGSLVCLMGPGMEARATITAWEPPHRFAAESSDFGPDAPLLCTEWTVHPRADGGHTVRVEHSMESDDAKWDEVLNNTKEGWPGFFRVLRLYLAHFAGEPVALVPLVAAVAVPEPVAWANLSASLGLTEASVGSAVVMAPANAPALSGRVEYFSAQPNWHEALVRLDDPTPGIASLSMFMMGEQTHVMLSLFFYGADAAERAAAHEPTWRAWLERWTVDPET